jgi:AcrR family transcriptional regulator
MRSGESLDAARPAVVTGEDARVKRTRADVARTALGLLVAEGSDALTHARVAEIAGYSKTTLYSHWPARLDLFKAALGALGESKPTDLSGDPRTDLIAQLKMFRQAVTDQRLDRVLSAMAQWASVEEMGQIRDAVNTEGQRPLRTILQGVVEGAELEAAISMLTGVVACPSLMFGRVPEDDVIESAVDMVLTSANR